MRQPAGLRCENASLFLFLFRYAPLVSFLFLSLLCPLVTHTYAGNYYFWLLALMPRELLGIDKSTHHRVTRA
jgi:hypothetical protein